MRDDLHFWVFSYNRGEFLRHCVETIERCAPGHPLTIFDDRSDEPDTLAVLESLARRHRVEVPGAGPGTGKHGGLYANMQAAFAAMPAGSLMCFLQDDMQLVRPLRRDEVRAMADWLRATDAPGFLQPAFLKAADRQANRPMLRHVSAHGGYCIDRYKRSAGAWYSDILVADVDTLRRVGWRFLPREAANERQARERLGQMIYLSNPFAAWLPAVPAFRGRTATMALRLAQHWGRCGFYPLRCMDPARNRVFCRRPARQLPYAEDFLRPESGVLPEPWRYHPLQGRRVLKLCNSLELKLRRLMRF